MPAKISPEYQIVETDNDLDIRMWRIVGSFGQPYYVAYMHPPAAPKIGSRRGGWSCTCPDYLMTRQFKGEVCKHIKMAKEEKSATRGRSSR